MKKVLITGASGFIGSHTVESALDRGYSVRVFLRYNSTGYVGNLRFLGKKLKEIEIFWGDIRDYTSVLRAVKGVDYVIHLAAQISVPYSFQNPIDFAMNNVVGTTNILKASVECGISKFVYTSTSEIFGGSDEPLNEDSLRIPKSPYSASKVGADAMVKSFFYTYNLNTLILRPFNTFGPRQSIRALIPWIIYQGLRSEKVKLGNLEPKRDFTYVKDTVEGILLSLEKETEGGDEINLGTGRSFSVMEVVEVVSKVLGKDLKVEVEENFKRPKKAEVFNLIADNSKAKRVLGWEPKWSFEEGVRETVEYVRSLGDISLEGWV
ncbi:MAG: GDP-mannose 4,6-dehydratase [Candidatus Caldipriscus sp.]|nr:GDP-mannose 4,6-dehydratase [Candidatus Caldipriscus sp.]